MTWHVETQHPVAVDSLDHLHPHGTIRDNNSNTRFVEKLSCEITASILPRVTALVLDIGCAGGAFVKELNGFLTGVDDIPLGLSEFDAIGIEGSDINQKTKRAEWATIPDNLFTADATKPYNILFRGEPALFDCITAWEVLEHIERDDLTMFLGNVVNHSRPGALFICSVANSPSLHDGVDLHRTQEGPDFWIPLIESFGFKRDETLERYFSDCWIRVTDFDFVFRKT